MSEDKKIETYIKYVYYKNILDHDKKEEVETSTLISEWEEQKMFDESNKDCLSVRIQTSVDNKKVDEYEIIFSSKIVIYKRKGVVKK